MWLWHAVEEAEHKAVCFDVYQQVCGKGWVGTFTDRSGEFRNKGKFRAELYRDNGNWHFFGQYKPCKVFCSWIDWRGSFLEER
jgi:predicted metal-dependent hydrolase